VQHPLNAEIMFKADNGFRRNMLVSCNAPDKIEIPVGLVRRLWTPHVNFDTNRGYLSKMVNFEGIVIRVAEKSNSGAVRCPNGGSGVCSVSPQASARANERAPGERRCERRPHGSTALRAPG